MIASPSDECLNDSVSVCAGSKRGSAGLGGATEVDYQPSYLSDSKEGGCSKGFSILSELEFELIGS